MARHGECPNKGARREVRLRDSVACASPIGAPNDDITAGVAQTISMGFGLITLGATTAINGTHTFVRRLAESEVGPSGSPNQQAYDTAIWSNCFK